MTEPTQEQCAGLVEREVLACISYLVGHLLEREPELLDEFENRDVRRCPECGDEVPTDADDSERNAAGDDCYRCGCCDKLIRLDDCDYEPQEIFEFWIVTSWLAGKLSALGEPVCHDLYGTCVWGRTTTGQAIKIDGPIIDIQRQLNARRST